MGLPEELEHSKNLAGNFEKLNAKNYTACQIECIANPIDK